MPATTITVPGSVSVLPSAEVEGLLSGLSLGDLSKTQLTEALSKLPSLSSLPADKLKEALSKTIEELTGKDATLGALLDPSEVVATLESELKKLLSLPELLSLLKGESLTSKLTTALDSLDPSKLLALLLGSTSEPGKLLDGLFADLSPQAVKALLGSTLTGAPFSTATIAELAGELGMSTATLTKELASTPAQLPETTTALTAPLLDGKTLGLLDSLGGITLSLISPATQEKESSGSGGEGSGGSGSGGSGSSGSGEGSGGSGSGGSSSGGSSEGSTSNPSGSGEGGGSSAGGAGATTLVVNLPAAQSTATSPVPAPSAKSTQRPGEVKILSHRVRGTALTVVVEIPAAGKLALSGSGIRSVHREAATARRMRIRTALTKASVASLRRHRRELEVRLKASFKTAGGSSSTASAVVIFA